MEWAGGVDIGGTKIRWVAARGGRVLFAQEIKTPHTRAAVVVALRRVFASLARRKVRRIGVSFAGMLRGTLIVSARNIPVMDGLDFRRFAPRGASMLVDNDARCFGRSEALLGSGRHARRLLALVFGTGVGRAYARNGKILPLVRFTRSEPWEGAYQKRLSLPSRHLAPFLARELRPLVHKMNPDVLVVGGGLMRKPDLFTLLQRELHKQGIRIPIRRSRFRQNGPAIGAALLVEK